MGTDWGAGVARVRTSVPSAPCPSSPGAPNWSGNHGNGCRGTALGPGHGALVGGIGGCWAHAGSVCVCVPEWAGVYLSVCVSSCVSVHTCSCPSVSECPVCVCTHGGVCVHMDAHVCCHPSPGSACVMQNQRRVQVPRGEGRTGSPRARRPGLHSPAPRLRAGYSAPSTWLASGTMRGLPTTPRSASSTEAWRPKNQCDLTDPWRALCPCAHIPRNPGGP